MATILVIEDEQDICEIISEILSEADHTVFTASNGRIGVERAQETAPDLIICDIMMPELDGYGVLSYLRSQERFQTVPFIFLTAKAEKQQVREGMNLGADDYLSKPFTITELIGAVEARLQKQQLWEQSSNQRLGELRQNLTRSLPHELLTPLNGILGYATFLCEEHEEIEPEDVYDMGMGIRTSAERLYHSIQNFLLYAQLELLKDNVQRSGELFTGQTEQLTGTVSARMTAIAQRHHRAEDLVIYLDDSPVAMPETWLIKVLEELVDNAFKFSEAGTPVQVKLTASGDQVQVTVSDRGRGLQPEQIKQLGAYEQFDRQLYEQQGSGLGLEIVQRIVKLNQGTLTIDSQPGELTQVRLTLPTQLSAAV